MAYTGITRLRLNTSTGEAQMGSGEVVSARAQEGTSFGGYSAEDLRGITPFASYQEFVDATQSEQYKGSWQTARESEEFRELCAKRLAAMDMVANRDSSAPQDTASQIVAADPTLNPHIVQRAVAKGGFISHEERQNAYASPLYKTSQDYRDEVVTRDAMTDL